MEYLPADLHTNDITPVADVFEVNHLGVPATRRESWSIQIGGLVRWGLDLTMADLEDMPHCEVTAFHECAGSPLYPHIPQRRIANVKWTGVPLALVLREIGIDERARYVISRGADRGTWQSMRHPSYEKDLPLAKALDPSVLLAVAMNDTPLSIGHGGPVRLVVPGYYGTNSTKWLRQLMLSASRSRSAFTTTYYTDREVVEGVIRETPVWDVAPNSIIVAPSNRNPVGRGPGEIWGWSWGAHPITRLDVSTDNEETWTCAELETRNGYSWQRFRLSWNPLTVGEYCISSRARDERGHVQPFEARRNRVYRRIIHVESG